MKKFLTLGLAAGMLFFLNACNNNTGSTAENNNNMNADSSKDKVEQAQDMNDAKKIDDDDSKFVTEAASGGMMEVEMGRMAVEHGTDPEIKKFGQKMVDDHSKANEELKALAATKNITLPAGLSDDHKKDMDDLMKEKMGKDWDKKYVDEMVDDHDKDVDKFEKMAKDAKDPDIRAWAEKTVPTLRSHKDMIHKIKDRMK